MADVFPSSSKRVSCWCGGASGGVPFSADYDTCRNCGTLVSQHPTSPEELVVTGDEQGLYGKGYWLEHQTAGHGLPDIHARARLDLHDRCPYWLGTLLQYMPPPARVLELGASHGGFAALLRQAGYDATGLEMSPWVVEFAQQTFGVPMLTGPLEQQDLPPASFDGIALMDVLEHLPNPQATMQRCLELLKPEGIVLLQTPCHRGKSHAQLLEDRDVFTRMLNPRSHLFLFTEDSLRRLFRRLGAEHVSFFPPVFEHDMFAVVSRAPLTPVDEALQRKALEAGPGPRVAGALVDLFKRTAMLQQACDERMKVIESLQAAAKQNVPVPTPPAGPSPSERAAKTKVREQRAKLEQLREKISRLENDLQSRRHPVKRLLQRFKKSAGKRKDGKTPPEK